MTSPLSTLSRRVVVCLAAVVAILLWPGAARAQDAQPAPATGDQVAPGLTDEASVPLIVWNRELAVFRTTLRAATPQQRAAAAAERLTAALDRLSPDQVRGEIVTAGADRGVLVLGEAATFFVIHERDLPQDSATTLEAALPLVVGRVQALLRDRTEQRRWSVLASSIAQAVAATGVFLALWTLLLRVRHRTLAGLRRSAGHRIARASVAGFDPRPLVFGALTFATRLAMFVVAAALAYMWLTFALSRFAYSRPWSQRLGALLLEGIGNLASSVVDEIPSLIALGLIFVVTRAVQAAAVAWFRAVERGDVTMTWIDPLAARAGRRLVSVGIWLFALTVAYPYLPGAETDAFKGVSVFVGLMLSLGSAGVIGQMMSGLFVVFNRALRPGEIVQIGEVSGVVKELGLVSVRLVTRNQKEVTIPNALVIGSAVTNLSRTTTGGVALSTSVTIGYDTPWRQVRAMLLLAAARTEGVLVEPKPDVLETALSDFYVEYELVASASAGTARAILLSRLHEQILDVFNEHGVQIMSPHFEGQPDKTVVVPKQDWFAAPAAGGPSEPGENR